MNIVAEIERSWEEARQKGARVACTIYLGDIEYQAIRAEASAVAIWVDAAPGDRGMTFMGMPVVRVRLDSYLRVS